MRQNKPAILLVEDDEIDIMSFERQVRKLRLDVPIRVARSALDGSGQVLRIDVLQLASRREQGPSHRVLDRGRPVETELHADELAVEYAGPRGQHGNRQIAAQERARTAA